ncbi:hypothetical protein BDFB_009985 [Asbolus verrucosus]|uniref:Uncharacterized protein n=1 Tax=Asbolus verrucosus TaxID=1661398 RepID=A0A482VK50_ASBVE|nr:hypothetical protein BDFB_009985 [Asbolus verrucosus]
MLCRRKASQMQFMYQSVFY